MKHITYAYIRGGVVYRDETAYEADDRLGTYNIIDDGNKKYAETSSIGGKIYKTLWLWNEKDVENDRNYGVVPLLSLN